MGTIIPKLGASLPIPLRPHSYDSFAKGSGKRHKISTAKLKKKERHSGNLERDLDLAQIRTKQRGKVEKEKAKKSHNGNSAMKERKKGMKPEDQAKAKDKERKKTKAKAKERGKTKGRGKARGKTKERDRGKMQKMKCKAETHGDKDREIRQAKANGLDKEIGTQNQTGQKPSMKTCKLVTAMNGMTMMWDGMRATMALSDPILLTLQ